MLYKTVLYLKVDVHIYERIKSGAYDYDAETAMKNAHAGQWTDFNILVWKI